LSGNVIARRCFVSGRVQGVYFRASARQQAQALNLAGHARNLPDGRVEVLVAGPPVAVAKLIDWLGQGPPSARVDTVDVIEIEVESSDLTSEFHVR
jgi:acylphosphatase